jgi:hypothetical protein
MAYGEKLASRTVRTVVLTTNRVVTVANPTRPPPCGAGNDILIQITSTALF